jgi:hypothetical protein
MRASQKNNVSSNKEEKHQGGKITTQIFKKLRALSKTKPTLISCDAKSQCCGTVSARIQNFV